MFAASIASECSVSAHRPSILLTGFGPFPGRAHNATAALVPELAAVARSRFPDHEIVDAVLPVEWTRAPLELDELLKRGDAALALHFGVAREARGFQIESIGRNICGALYDASGALPRAAQLIDDAPESLTSTFPVERIMMRLKRASLPCSISLSAGTYLCNALLYHSLTAALELSTPFVAGFVHLPASLAATGEAECPLSWDDALAGGIEIIAACLEKETIA